jgi:hypothetical protein
MSRLKRFFSASARDLNMKQFTPYEIAAKMQQTDENSLRLPRGFARTVSRILQDTEDADNKTLQPTAKRRG